MRGRFRRKKLGEDPIKGILEWQISTLKKAVDSGETAIKQRERAVALLSDYDFANDISKGPFRVRRAVPFS